ncbi:response regulator [Comamonadaceae bacterium M7527]|nr:response regulator [Comamonadaceae bacterium M7527]
MANILVVDDEHGIRDLLIEILDDEGHNVTSAQNAGEARAARNNARPDLVLLDIWMPDTDGVSLLKEWASNGQLDMPVIMMSGHATIETAVEATRIGALAFLEKPITMQKLLQAVELGLNKSAAKNTATQAVADSTAHQPAPSAGLMPDALGQQASASSHYQPSHAAHTSASVQHFELDKPLREARDDFEKAYFEFHLSAEGGSMTRVADKTGLERTHLYRKLKQLGIDLSKAKKGML